MSGRRPDRFDSCSGPKLFLPKRGIQMKIGIDFDGVMNNMLETWVEWLNKEHSTQVKAEDVTEWELAKKYPGLTRSELFKPLNTPEFWDEVTIKHEAPEVVEKLIAEGHEIYVITSTHYKR